MAFFVATVGKPRKRPICWNQWSKIVQDVRDGTIDYERTNKTRARLGLPVPWTPEMAERECCEPPISNRMKK